MILEEYFPNFLGIHDQSATLKALLEPSGSVLITRDPIRSACRLEYSDMGVSSDEETLMDTMAYSTPSRKVSFTQRHHDMRSAEVGLSAHGN